MKPLRLIPASLAIAALFCVGCEEEEVHGLDTSAPVPENVVYNAANTTATLLAVSWDASKAVKAGAVSFTVQANTTAEGGGDNYNGDITQIVSVEDAQAYTEGAFDKNVKYYNATTLTKLPQGGEYYVRVRANYRNSVFSEWVYVSTDGTAPTAGVVSLSVPTLAKDAKVMPTTVTLSWAKVGAATSYVVEYREKGAASWNKYDAGKLTSVTIEDLETETEYEFRVKAIKKTTAKTYESEYTEVLAVKTLETAEFFVKNADELIALLSGTKLTEKGEAAILNLTADIDLAGKTLPVVAEYLGTFNGGSHTIKNWDTTHPLFNKLSGAASAVVFDKTCVFTASQGNVGILAGDCYGDLSDITNNANVTMTLSEDAISSISLGGIVGATTGALKNCVNNGKVVLKSPAALNSTLVGGVAGYVGGVVENCKNTAEVNVAALCLKALTPVGPEGVTVTNVPIMAGGIAAISKSPVSNSHNEGAIKYHLTDISQQGVLKGLGRVNIGGVIAGPEGNVSNCSNKGAIKIEVYTADRKAYGAANYILCVGGISGGDDYAADDNRSSIIECTNEGNIDVDFDASKSNSAIGGIVGWPGVESAEQTVVTKDCVNKGNVTVSGAGKGRFGGIHGGAGNVTGSKNYGTVTNNTKVKGSAVGGVAGYASYNLKHENNENYGDVINHDGKGDLVNAGGLVGAYAGQDGTIGVGCVVKCKVVVDGTQKYAGMVLGRYNGNNNKIVIGSASDPCQVSGSIQLGKDAAAVTMTADNLDTYATGTERNKDETKRPVHVTLGK